MFLMYCVIAKSYFLILHLELFGDPLIQMIVLVHHL
jgi:hypothetical protein